MLKKYVHKVFVPLKHINFYILKIHVHFLFPTLFLSFKKQWKNNKIPIAQKSQRHLISSFKKSTNSSKCPLTQVFSYW